MALTVVALVVTGCNDSALTKQELVVTFSQGAPQSAHLAALRACAHVTPAATPEPYQVSKLASDNVGNVRFRIDHADDKQVATLEDCLSRQPDVEGVYVPDYTD